MRESHWHMPQGSADQVSAMGGRGRVESCCYGACPPDGAQVPTKQPCISRLRTGMEMDPANLKEVPRALCFVHVEPLTLWPNLPPLTLGTCICHHMSESISVGSGGPKMREFDRLSGV